MATYFARKAGNINAADVWATTPSGTAAAVTFGSDDVLMSNGFTVNVNVSVNLGLNGQIRNDTTGGATAGGGFTTTAATTLTANVFAGSSGTQCLSVGHNTTLSGNITGGTASLVFGANLNAGTLTMTGNVMGGTSTACIGISAANNTGLIVTGNVTGGSGAGGQNEGIRSSTQNITVTGNITGGSANIGNHGLRLISGSINVTGIVAGGASAVGINNESTGNITLVGTAMPSNGASGINNTSTGQVSATRITANGYGPGSVGVSNVFGIVVTSAQSSFVQLEQMEYGALGQPPVSGKIRFTDNPGNYIKVNTSPSTTKTLIDATQNAAMPAASNVRSGVSYASGALTGSCAVPAAGSVALGVPVDNTTGTAVLTPEAVWGHASRTITGGLVDTATTLTNAPIVPTASQIASQVRTELSSELAKVAALNTTRLGQVTTTEILGNLLSQANS
jgi:hypothetical protein